MSSEIEACDHQPFLDKVKHVIKTWWTAQSENAMDDEDEEKETRKLLQALEELDTDKIHSIHGNGTEPPTKKPKHSNEATASKAAKKTIEDSKMKTIKDVALLIIDRCQDEDLDKVVISGELIKKGGKSRDKFREEIAKLDPANIDYVTFRNSLTSYSIWQQDRNLDDVYRRLESEFSPIANLQEALRGLFSPNQDIDKDVMNWKQDFVIPEDDSMLVIEFPRDLSKCSARVITGESGSGKSWFVKHWLPWKHQRASFIYHELTNYEADEFRDFKPENEDLSKAYKMAMKLMMAHGEHVTKWYDAVSDLSRSNNRSRNEAAVSMFNRLVQKTLEPNATASEWWRNPSHTLEELIIILDEMGKKPQLARGIVDEVRRISIEIRHKNLAEKVMIVLVGSGLDYFINEDGIDPFLEEDPYEGVFYRSFGTDPMKSDVTVLKIKGPNLESESKICDVPVKDIKQGTYSRVLATNTRMLTHGVIPIMRSKFNTLRVDNPSSRRVAVGSTNVIMDYAARIYIDLNGLANLHTMAKSKFELMLLRQFQLLVLQSRRECQPTEPRNPSFDVSWSVSREDYETVLRAGLITANIKGTSGALRYLACKGQTAPLSAQDGAAFEIVVQHHLVRLCRAECDKEAKEYYCDRYELQQAWPPSSITNIGLDTTERVERAVDETYRREHTGHRRADDVAQIAKLVGGRANFDLVLRQSVGNAQGADVLVLSKREEESRAFLDLYQAKHYRKFPSRGSEQTRKAFASIGVRYNAENHLIDAQPTIGPEAYSYLGTLKFASSLSEQLGVPVSIRRRTVVYSGEWKSLLECTSWKAFGFEEAKTKNVWIWTREMLEPTVSVLTIKPAEEVPKVEYT